MVSLLYMLFLEASHKKLPIEDIWYRDINGAGSEDSNNIGWDSIWANLKHVYKNPNHQLIHFKMIHRMYLTPRKCHLMNISTSPTCTFCSNGCIGTFMLMFWDCPEVNKFWRRVSTTLKDILDLEIACCPRLSLLTDDSLCAFSLTQNKLFFCELMAAKKMLALRWKPRHSIAWNHWM